MAPIIDTWFVLVLSVAGWLKREQDKSGLPGTMVIRAGHRRELLRAV